MLCHSSLHTSCHSRAGAKDADAVRTSTEHHGLSQTPGLTSERCTNSDKEYSTCHQPAAFCRLLQYTDRVKGIPKRYIGYLYIIQPIDPETRGFRVEYLLLSKPEPLSS